MPAEISLVFLGGIADSGKSALQINLEKLPGVDFVSISDFFKVALDKKLNKLREREGILKALEENQRIGEALRALDYVDWKSKAEDNAIKGLSAYIQEMRKQKSLDTFSTLIVNTHFATNSPGGFMAGLDPAHIRLICKECDLLGMGRTRKAAVILVDIAISDVLQRREDHWAKYTERSSTGPGLIQDLEFNRLYALHYYHVLSQLLGLDRVAYHRILMEWRGEDTKKDIDETDALARAFRGLEKFLKEENLILS